MAKEQRYQLISDPSYDSIYYIVDTKRQNDICTSICNVPTNIKWADLNTALNLALAEKFGLQDTDEKSLKTLWEESVKPEFKDWQKVAQLVQKYIKQQMDLSGTVPELKYLQNKLP